MVTDILGLLQLNLIIANIMYALGSISAPTNFSLSKIYFSISGLESDRANIKF